MARVRDGVFALLGAAGALLGIVLGVVFIALMFGGGIYRTECTIEDGRRITDWGFEGGLPYLWSPGDDRCEAHTLTRYLLGEVGVMGEVE